MKFFLALFASLPLLAYATQYDVAAYASTDCTGEELGVADADNNQSPCITAVNGASLELATLPSNCDVYTYDTTNCTDNGTIIRVIPGPGSGCSSPGDFSSFSVACFDT
ncbi:hypothetical protein BV22DRAFT_1029036 [Leucogyrophana mollusca]|uniref:Uncharacterized protein n=1 Tax=Leucogyrophana mollusca TaxID=85980 RepID=A0ACB8BYC1_9AGAM|nr:hypothetical protein BV22DRAFT_1029036 [Leucogyrophana mollusca]